VKTETRPACRRGYRRIWLTTGPRQPEAERLYLHLGHQPRYDLDADRATLPYLPFETQLPISTLSPLRPEART
jgi:hypothetical protein